MLRAVATQRSLLIFGSHWRELSILQSSPKLSQSITKNNVSVVGFRFDPPFSRVFLHYKVHSNGYDLFGRNTYKDYVQRIKYTKNFHSLADRRSSITHHMLSTWKRLNLKCYTKNFHTLAERRSSMTHHMLSTWKSLNLKCYTKNFHTLAERRSSMTHHMLSTWKRLNIKCYTKNFHTLAERRSSVTHHMLSTWKRLNLKCYCQGPNFYLINRLACTVSLAFTRFKVVPCIVGLTVGELACGQKAEAYAEHVVTWDNMLSRTQNQRVSFTLFLQSIKDVFILIFRALYLAILFTPSIAMAPFTESFNGRYRTTWLNLVHRTLEKAGPAFIKWGQWAATRPDLFPKDLCNELAKLHTKAPTHSFDYSKKTIEKAFGRKISEIFDHFEETPVASGSIAQIHRASLRYQYRGKRLSKPIEVAVKVRHPGVGESIRRDFTIINVVAQFSKFIPALNWLRLDESVHQFAVFMLSQVDLAREAAHLGRFIHNFRRWKDVSFPKPLYPLVHPSVLVETFEQGDSVSRYIDEHEGNTRIKRDLANIGTHALLKMLLVDNFIHADMHPGNILVRLPQKKEPRKSFFRSKPHIIFLDVGMTAELSPSDRLNLHDFFKAVAIRDGRTAAECTLRLSKRQSCPNPKAFIEELERTFTFWGTPEGDIFHPVECMHQLLEQVRRHRVNIDGNVCTVLVTILVLEGWQHKLDPDFDIMRTLNTLLLKEDVAQPIDYFS